MRVLKGQTIENDTVDIDDTYLVNCKLKNCNSFIRVRSLPGKTPSLTAALCVCWVRQETLSPC
jgi:hypothetical protein